MIYVTYEQMRRLDEYAVKKCGILTVTLMENAGRAVADEVVKIPGASDILVFSGYGNNGGDGFVAARYLKKKGYNVKSFLVGMSRMLGTESKSNLDALMKLGLVPKLIESKKDIDNAFDRIKKPAIVVDAIFGIGIRGLLDEFHIAIINRINDTGFKIISVDIPSGLDADTGEPKPVAIKAFKTVTLGYPKIGFTKPAAKKYLGEMAIAYIGLPAVDVTKI